MKGLVCRKCGETRESEFYLGSIRIGDKQCKSCRRKADKQWRLENLERSRERSRNYMRTHPEKNRANFANWYDKHKESHYEWRLNYIRENPERHRAQCYAFAAFPEALKCEREGCTELGERHHEDYGKPYEIQWLCRKHHRELNRILV